MKPEQKKQLVDACNNNDAVKISTIALAIAATLAKQGKRGDACRIRSLYDRNQTAEHMAKEYRKIRLDIAKTILPLIGIEDVDLRDAVKIADDLIKINDEEPLP